jgi:hypothetical protein
MAQSAQGDGVLVAATKVVGCTEAVVQVQVAVAHLIISKAGVGLLDEVVAAAAGVARLHLVSQSPVWNTS